MKTTFSDFDEFLQGFLAAAFWSSTIDGDGYMEGQQVPLDDEYEPSQLTERAKTILTAHAMSFWSRMWFYLDHEIEPKASCNGDHSPSKAGHDFWLTSAGHGAGFWDGDWPKYGDMLTKLSKCYPCEHINFYITDDGDVDIG